MHLHVQFLIFILKEGLMNSKRILHVLASAAVVCFVFATVQARADIYMKQKVHTDEFKMMGQTQPAKDAISVFWLGENGPGSRDILHPSRRQEDPLHDRPQ
jgi:hypothetical protein